MEQHRINNNFSGWWVVFTGFMVIFIVIGFGLNTAGVFLRSISRDLGYGKAAFSLVLSISAIAGFFNAILAGRLMKKFDPQKVTLVYLVITIIGTFMYSRCTELYHFYIICVITGIGTTGCTMLPMTMIIGNWFVKKRATAISIVIAGNGLGGFVFNPAAVYLIEKNPFHMPYGYQSAYIVSSLLMLFVCLPLVAVFLKSDPSKCGQCPDGIKNKISADSPKKASAFNLSLSNSLKTAEFFLLSLMVVGFAVVYMGTNQHLFVYLTEVASIAPVQASFLVGLYMLMTVVGILVFGWATDKFGIKVSFTASSLILFFGLLFLGLAHAYMMVGLALCIFGFGNLVHTVVPPIMTTHCFGKEDYSSIYGIVLAIQSIGISMGPLIGGLIFDRDGNYNTAYYLCLLLVILSGICGLAILKISAKRRKKLQ